MFCKNIWEGARKTLIEFLFQESKAIEAMSYLLSLNGGHMNYMVAIKMLYFADREMLANGHISITTDSYAAGTGGPVLQNILARIKEGESRNWNDHIGLNGPCVELIAPLEEYKEISEQEREVIARIYGEFRCYKRIELLEYCQGLKEWRAPHGCFVPIGIDSILDAAVPLGSRKEICRKLGLCATEQKKQLQFSKKTKKTKKTGAETPV